MPDPTVQFWVCPDDYRIAGGTDEPLTANVTYLTRWADAFTFYNDVLGGRTASSVGPITSLAPYRFPPSPNLFAQRAEIQPIGADQTTLAKLGLAPGEYFTYAKIHVEFRAPKFNPLGDTNFQLDPSAPITYAEVEVDQSARFESVQASGYEFDNGEPVTGGDVSQIIGESRLILTFPQIPFLPWRQVRPYIGRINLNEFLDCPVGTLLLEGTKIKFTGTSQGVQGRQVQLVFVEQELDWNKRPRKNGTYDLIRKKGLTTERVYKYIDFTPIFAYLQ